MPSPRPDLRLVSCTFLDAWNVTMTVRECWTEKRWGGLKTIQREQIKCYDLAIRVGRFLDGTSYVLRQDPRHFRLCELFAGWRLEQKLDAYVGIDPPVVTCALPRAL
jgi:hypothetical protein